MDSNHSSILSFSIIAYLLSFEATNLVIKLTYERSKIKPGYLKRSKDYLRRIRYLIWII